VTIPPFGTGTVPQYSFTIRSVEHEHAECNAVLEDDAAALDFACRMVRELSGEDGYNDPGLAVSVRNEMREIVLSVPFLPACA
jgi:hypothetical protein